MVTRLFAYRIVLRAHAVFPTLGGDPNSAQSLAFMPGSAIRGAVTRALARGATLDAAAEPLRSMALSGDICYLNAYPMEQDVRTVPAPRSLRESKSGSGTLYDLLAYAEVSEGLDGTEPAWPEEPLKPLENPFITIGKADTFGGKPSTANAFHHQRDRVKGRAFKNQDGQTVGAVFSYESLQKGQAFAGAIAITGKDAAAVDARFGEVKARLTDRDAPVLVGRSRRAGYGGDAQIVWEDSPREREASGDAGLITGAVKKGQRFRALLTSNYVGRDRTTGQTDPLILRQELEDRLDHKAKVIMSCCIFQTVGGYNSFWKLPLPQANAMAAGAVFLLEATEDVPYALLHGIEQSALGERRAEGYGRVLFLDPPPPHPNIRRRQPQHTRKPDVDVPPLITLMQRRLLEKALERAIAQAASDIADPASAKQIPTPSLLQRLRLPLRESGPDNIRSFNKYLAGLKNPAKDALMSCRVHLPNEDRQIRLFEWLEELTTDGARKPLIVLLNLEKLAQDHHITSQGDALSLLKGDLDPWIRQRLLAETLAALSRRQTAEKGPNRG